MGTNCRSIAWAYFEEAFQGDPPLCRAGIVIHMSDTPIIKFKVGLVKVRIIVLS